ncbi:MAG: lytic transglycosylase domain-containing protein [bacterium]
MKTTRGKRRQGRRRRVDLHLKRAILAGVLALLFSFAHATAQESDSQYSKQQIEDMYLKVVYYYNPKLSRNDAVRIVRGILFYSAPQMFGVDPRLVVAVIAVESRFQPNAVSPKGAIGLGQLMPGTARQMGVRNPRDIEQNIYGTVRYLREQYNRWAREETPLDYALASYNAGPEAVAKHRGIPPYRETINYVKKVKQLYKFFRYGR